LPTAPIEEEKERTDGVESIKTPAGQESAEGGSAPIKTLESVERGVYEVAQETRDCAFHCVRFLKVLLVLAAIGILGLVVLKIYQIVTAVLAWGEEGIEALEEEEKVITEKCGFLNGTIQEMVFPIFCI